MRFSAEEPLRQFLLSLAHKKFMRKSRPFISLQSARGPAQSKTLRVFQESSCRAQRLGLRRPSAAFPRAYQIVPMSKRAAFESMNYFAAVWGGFAFGGGK